jgi:hypothetical protein
MTEDKTLVRVKCYQVNCVWQTSTQLCTKNPILLNFNGCCKDYKRRKKEKIKSKQTDIEDFIKEE